MKRFLFSVRDTVSTLFAPPFVDVNHGSAIRGFKQVITRDDSNNAVSSHPADYELYVFGSFDDETGRFDILDVPERISRGSDHIGVSQ